METSERTQLVAAIRKYMASQNLSRDQFAFKAHLSRSAIDKMLVGNFSPKTIDKIEANLGVRFRESELIDRVSAEDLGSYRYSDVATYEGEFRLLRRDLMSPNEIHSYAMRIEWSTEHRGLIVRHKGINESLYRQFGTVSFAKDAKYFL